MKISTKLYAGFIIVVALTAALGLYTYYVNGKSLTEAAGSDAVFQAEDIIKNIDKSIHDKIMEVGAATRRNWVISIVAESNARFEQMESIDGYLAETESQWTAASGDRANALQQELMSNDLANELRGEFITFNVSLRGYRVLNNLLVTNKFGASIAQTDKIDHFRHDKEIWWQETRRLGVYIGKIEHNKGTNSYGIPASFSMVDAEGNFMGVLKTVIDIKAQIRTIELAARKYKTTQITILTADGNIIYRTRPYRFMEDFSSWKYFNRLQMKENFFAGISMGSKEKLYSYTRSKGYRHYPGFNWILIVENDLEEIIMPAHDLRNKIAIASLLLVLIGATIAFVISSSVTRSLAKLNEGTSRIGRGDLDYSLEMKNKDEFGLLAISFNTMVQNLRKITASRDELDKEITVRKVAEIESQHLTVELSRKNKELEQIVYVTSHDLRSPLVNVQGFAGELENSIRELALFYESEKFTTEEKEKIAPLLKEDIPESLKYIKKGIVKMDALLAGLLRLSRLGRVNLNLIECDMNRLMADVAATADYQVKSAGATIELSQLPPCRGDYDQVNQIFSNLLDNALKHLDPNRPGRISISGQVSNDQAVYCVADNGIGIATENHLKIFEIFHQLNPATGSGEGLGLTIISRSLERQNGRVRLRSEPGKGSQFYVELPKV